MHKKKIVIKKNKKKVVVKKGKKKVVKVKKGGMPTRRPSSKYA